MKNVFILILLLLIPVNALAYIAQFSWVKNLPPLTGYTLYFKESTAPGIPFDCVGLNNDGPIDVPMNTSHNPDPKVFATIDPNRGYLQLEDLSPYKEYSFALTAYANIPCEYEEGEPDLTKYREDGSPYCESLYSDVVTIDVFTNPTIQAVYLKMTLVLN